MFDMGFQELMLIGIVALLVIGPERLPGAVRTTTLWISRIRRSFQKLKSEIEDEIDADQLKRDFHNQSIMKSLERAKSDIQGSVEDLRPDLDKLDYDIKDIIEPPSEHSTDNDADNNPAEKSGDSVDPKL
jgi:sec-independent protein translocase protein TatB